MSESTEQVLAYFKKISSIPRRSREEEKIKNWIIGWADQNSYAHRQDQIGNIVCYVPGKGSLKDRPSIAIQGHLDMVCEKEPTSTHDFSKDGIELIVEGDWLKANQTTLGADNGIAIALAMKLADDTTVEHPPLELLFTIDEETGLTGALGLDGTLLTAKKLLNIDSEDEGVFTVGCAGGNTSVLDFTWQRESPSKEMQFFKINAGGMKGGHSGVDIHQQRANAVRVLVRLLKLLRSDDDSLQIVSVEGGNAHNAIPRDAYAHVCTKKMDRAKLQSFLKSQELILQKEFSRSDPQLFLSLEDASPADPFDASGTERLLDTVMVIPHGVVTMSLELPGIVETSTNLAQVNTNSDGMQILTSQRSSVFSRLVAVTEKVESIARLAGGKCSVSDGYPAWEPNWQSPITEVAVECYRKLFAKDPVVEIIHAGLECGIIGEKVAGMEMISFGPTIVDPHSPQERLKISDIDKIWRLLVELVRVI